MKKIEKTYGSLARGIMLVVNPIKKVAVKTTCIVHKFINIQAIQILSNENLNETSDFYKRYVKELNKGVTWADQDFKSTNHFFHYSKEKGLFGFSNALLECVKYHNMAVKYVKLKEYKKAMFCVGVASHLIQDSTVPQHVNNKLLKSHRNFELWIISNLFDTYDFSVQKGIIRYEDIKEYIKYNAKYAYETHEKFSEIKDKELRYYNISMRILQRAQMTTAGYLSWFYDQYIKNSL